MDFFEMGDGRQGGCRPGSTGTNRWDWKGGSGVDQTQGSRRKQVGVGGNLKPDGGGVTGGAALMFRGWAGQCAGSNRTWASKAGYERDQHVGNKRTVGGHVVWRSCVAQLCGA